MKHDGAYGDLPPSLHLVMDGDEEINLTKFAKDLNSRGEIESAPCQAKPINGTIFSIDGPEETNPNLPPSAN
jgi:hypothetical protein